MSITFGHIEAVLAHVHNVSSSRRVTLQAKLKQLQRASFPPGVNVGRYAKVSYTAEHLFQIATLFELLRCGVPPARAIRAVTANWWACWTALYDAQVAHRGRLDAFAALARKLGVDTATAELQVEDFPPWFAVRFYMDELSDLREISSMEDALEPERASIARQDGRRVPFARRVTYPQPDGSDDLLADSCRGSTIYVSMSSLVTRVHRAFVAEEFDTGWLFAQMDAWGPRIDQLQTEFDAGTEELRKRSTFSEVQLATLQVRDARSKLAKYSDALAFAEARLKAAQEAPDGDDQKA